jgi:hypothetical protein
MKFHTFLIVLLATLILLSCAPPVTDGDASRIRDAETPMIITNLTPGTQDAFFSFTRYYDSEFNVVCYVKTVNDSMQCVYVGGHDHE